MNKCKIACWICAMLCIGLVLIAAYSTIDQAVTITYMQEGCTATKTDLEIWIDLIDKTNLTKDQIAAKL